MVGGKLVTRQLLQKDKRRVGRTTKNRMINLTFFYLDGYNSLDILYKWDESQQFQIADEAKTHVVNNGWEIYETATNNQNHDTATGNYDKRLFYLYIDRVRLKTILKTTKQLMVLFTHQFRNI